MASIASSWRPIALRNWPNVPSASTELALRATACARSASAPSQSQSYSIFTRPERGPCLGQPFVEGDRPLGMPARHRHRLVDLQRPQHRGRRHQQVGRRQPGMGHGVVGIERQRLLEQGQRLDQRQPCKRLEMGARLELQEVGLRRARAIAVQLMVVRPRRRGSDVATRRGDGVLQAPYHRVGAARSARSIRCARSPPR